MAENQQLLGFLEGGLCYENALQVENPDPHLALILQNVKDQPEEMSREFAPLLKGLPPVGLSQSEVVYEVFNNPKSDYFKLDIYERSRLLFQKTLYPLAYAKIFDSKVQDEAFEIAFNEINQINSRASESFEGLKTKLRSEEGDKKAAIQECIEALTKSKSELAQIKENGFSYYYDKAFEKLNNGNDKFIKRDQTHSNEESLNNLVNSNQKIIDSFLEFIQLIN